MAGDLVGRRRVVSLVIRGMGRTRSAAAGCVAVGTGVALLVFGATAPAAHGNVSGVSYACSVGVPSVLGGGQTPYAATMTASIAGGVNGPVQVGDSVTLQGFQTVGHLSWTQAPPLSNLLITSISGHYSTFRVDAQSGNGGPTQHVDASMDIGSTTPNSGGFDLIAPPSPNGLSGFTASQAGPLTFGAGNSVVGTLQVQTLISGVTGDQSWSITCDRTSSPSSSVIATTTVRDKPNPPTGHSLSPSAPPEQNAPQPVGLANGTPTTVPSTPSGTATGRSTSARPQLAKTGFSATEQLSVGGGLLILVGAGLMYLARRRAVGDA
jgi:LPXTG-motif cell wall-anchored protein